MQKSISQDYASYNITEAFLPRYRKGQFKHLILNKRINSEPVEKAIEPQRVKLDSPIIHNFDVLNNYISNLQTLFKARMEVHEQEIIQIAHSEIKKIQLQSQKIIKMYSNLINQKNISHEILDLRYQIKYYQQRACETYQENKKLRKQIKQLRTEIESFKLGEEASNQAMRNISKKYLKEKILRKNYQFQGKGKIISEISQSNIKISLFSGSDSHHNPEKLTPIQSTNVGQIRLLSSAPKQKTVNFFSQHIKKNKQLTPLKKKSGKIIENIKTQSTSQFLPIV